MNKSAPEFRVFAVIGHEAWGLLLEKLSGTDDEPTRAYFWLDSHDGLEPTDDIRFLVGNRCYRVDHHRDYQSKILRELRKCAETTSRFRFGGHGVTGEVRGWIV